MPFVGHFMLCKSYLSQKLHFSLHLIYSYFDFNSPPEIEAQTHVGTFEFQNVIHLFSISHKYHAESYEKWAIQLLLLHCGAGKSSSAHTPNRLEHLDEILCPTPKLEILLSFVVQTGHRDLIAPIETALLRRLEAQPSISISHTLVLAEELNLRRLQGFLYYHELKRQSAFEFESTTVSLPPKDLTCTQAAYFFRGWASLLSYWIDLPNHVRSKNLHLLQDGFTSLCTHELECQAEWERLWHPENLKKVLRNSPPRDGPLEWLEKLRAPLVPGPSKYSIRLCFPLSSDGAPTPYRDKCPCSHRELSALLAELRDAMENHFYGTPPEEINKFIKCTIMDLCSRPFPSSSTL